MHHREVVATLSSRRSQPAPKCNLARLPDKNHYHWMMRLQPLWLRKHQGLEVLLRPVQCEITSQLLTTTEGSENSMLPRFTMRRALSALLEIALRGYFG